MLYKYSGMCGKGNIPFVYFYAIYTGIILKTTSIFWLWYLPLKKSMRTPIFYPIYRLDLTSTMSDSLRRTHLWMLLFGSQLIERSIFYLITTVVRGILLLHSQEHHGPYLPKLAHYFNSLNFHRWENMLFSNWKFRVVWWYYRCF